MQNVAKLHGLSWGNVLSFHAEVLNTLLQKSALPLWGVVSQLMMDMYKGVVCCKLLSLSLQVLWVYSSGTLVRGKNVIIVLLVKTTCLGDVLSNLKLFQI